MRYPASEKLEIIRLVEESKLSAKRTLERLGVLRSNLYRRFGLFQRFGAALSQIAIQTVFPHLRTV